MTTRTTNRLKQAARSIRRRLTAHAVILHYHRVAELPSDPFLFNVPPQQFAEHLQVMKALGQPVPLTELTDALQGGKLPRRAIVVTFDDGYADNLQNAKPLLEQYGVPATVFVTTGPVQTKREFWWDELERLVLQPGELPRQLRLKVNGSVQEWELGTSAVFTEEDTRRHRAWTMATKSDPSSHHRVFRALYEKIYPLGDAEKRRVLNELAALSSAGQNARATHRVMRADEIVELARGGLVEIGAHTITHTPLTSLRPEQQRQEIEGSKMYLEQILARSITAFAYPHGLFTAETVEMLRQAGMTCACATVPDPVRPDSDPFRLPRMLAMHWSGEQLAERLEHWLRE
jgi:peptidoglycan/xylan/chitin deacetylase (PgdA/CDA1 family)